MIEAGNDHKAVAVGTLDSCLEQVLSDQVRDWLAGDCRQVKDYLDQLPPLIGQKEN